MGQVDRRDGTDQVLWPCTGRPAIHFEHGGVQHHALSKGDRSLSEHTAFHDLDKSTLSVHKSCSEDFKCPVQEDIIFYYAISCHRIEIDTSSLALGTVKVNSIS